MITWPPVFGGRDTNFGVRGTWLEFQFYTAVVVQPGASLLTYISLFVECG